MRCSVINSSPGMVKQAGGLDVKEAKTTKILFAELTEAQVQSLRRQGCVVSQVETIHTSITPPAPVLTTLQPLVTPRLVLELTGFEKLRGLFTPPLLGTGMKVAMIDTGIRETHEQVAGKVVYSKNYTTAPMQDGFSHGTGTASILAAVASECGILNLKVMDDEGEGTTEAVVLAIEDCIDLMDTRPDIAPSLINLSLGTEDTGDPNDILRIACRAAIDRGIWMNAAAGNGGAYAGTVMSPACERYVFATGSGRLIPLDSGYNFEISEFSSRGPTKEGLIKPDAIFFGENIQMASSESDTARVAKSGTSFAAPFTSGMIILYMQAFLYQLPTFTREEFFEIAKDMPAADFTSEYVPSQSIMDKYLQYITIKPQGVAKAKDNTWGHGLPFGDLVAQMVGARPMIDPGGMLGAMMVMMMMSMVMKSAAAQGSGVKKKK